MAVARAAVDAHEHTGMLDGVVGVVELGAHSAHVGALAVAEQFPQEILRENLDVVVEEQQMFALGKPGTEVVDGREVEGSLIPHHPAAVKPSGQRLVVGLGGRIGGVILDDEDLEIVVPGVLVEACQAAVQVVGVVLVGDQHADQRVAGQLVPHLEGAGGIGHRHGPAGQAQPLQLGIDGPLPRRDGVGFCLHARRRGPRVAPPDVEHLLDVLDLAGLFGEPQDQVVVLGTVKLAGFVGPRRVQQRAAEHRQMGDEVDAPQIVGGKIRLEVVAAQLFQVRREDDLVTVDKIRAGLLDGLHTFKEGVGIEYVVVVQQGQIPAGGGGKTRRGVGGNALILDFVVSDAAVPGGILPGPPGYLPVGFVAGVHQHQLPARICLALHALDHLVKEAQRRVVHRHHHTDAGALQVGGPLGFQRAAQRQVGPVAPVVVVEGQPHPKGHIPPELLGPLFPQGCHRTAGQVLQMGRVEQPAGHAAHAVLYGQVGGAFVVGLLLHGSLIPPSAWRAWRLPSGSCGIPG